MERLIITGEHTMETNPLQEAINNSVEMLTEETSRLHRLLAQKTLQMLGVERTEENWNE